MYILSINLNGANTGKFCRLFDLPYREPRVTENMLSLIFLRKVRLSSLTTMPRSFRVFGEKCPGYEQWLCDKLNRPVSRVIYHPGKYELPELESRVRAVMKNEPRPLRTVYEIYRENAATAIDYVKRHQGVGSIQQWLDDNLDGLQDQPFTSCTISVLNKATENTVFNLFIDTKDDLTAWYANVKKLLTSEGITCSIHSKVVDNEAAATNNKV